MGTAAPGNACAGHRAGPGQTPRDRQGTTQPKAEPSGVTPATASVPQALAVPPTLEADPTLTSLFPKEETEAQEDRKNCWGPMTNTEMGRQGVWVGLPGRAGEWVGSVKAPLHHQFPSG